MKLLDFCSVVESFVLFKNIRQDIVVKKLCDTIHCLTTEQSNGSCGFSQANMLYSDFLSLLIEKSEEMGLSGNVLRQYLICFFLNDQNTYSLACERRELNSGASLRQIALKDMENLLLLMSFNMMDVCKLLNRNEDLTHYMPAKNRENPFVEHIEILNTKEELLDAFTMQYSRLGCGYFGAYRAFRYANQQLVGIKAFDSISFDDIIGYEQQKKRLKENTLAFLRGNPANNVILFGSRGTGKSSCVKALANSYFEQGLRLIEISKEDLNDLPQLLQLLVNRGKYFVLFIDDLSFEENESSYKHLKSLLEGGVEKRPKNVLFCATSNRRHFIKETWNDKTGMAIVEGEVHASDTTNEKLSLSDRFGLHLTFQKPSPEEYFSIVKALAKKQKLGISDDILRLESNAWQLENNGLSGRTAKQFVEHMICEIRK